METPEQRRERWKRWYAMVKNDPTWRERRKSAKRVAYERNKGKVRAAQKLWVAKNRDKTRETWRRFYANHADAERERSKKRAQYRKNATRLWAKLNPLKRAANESRRRARQRETACGDVDYAAVVQAAHGICAICGLLVGNEPAHIDHIIPLARGGSHTQNNLQFTHGRCNNAKGARLLMKVAG